MKFSNKVFLNIMLALGLLSSLPNSVANPAQQTVSPLASVFVGEVIAINNEMDGSVVQLKNTTTNAELYAVLSPANLGPNSTFDFATLKTGLTLKVTGEPFQLGEKTQMAARTVLSYQDIPFADKQASPAERAACQAVGGTISKAGRAQFDFCAQNYTDAKHACTDGSQCFGDCLMATSADHAKPGDRVAGYCAETNQRFGCKPLVTDGKYEGTLCID